MAFFNRNKLSGLCTLDQTVSMSAHVDRVGKSQALRDLESATFGRGPIAGKTGNPLKDDPFFNPWIKGGTFNP